MCTTGELFCCNLYNDCCIIFETYLFLRKEMIRGLGKYVDYKIYDGGSYEYFVQ